MLAARAQHLWSSTPLSVKLSRAPSRIWLPSMLSNLDSPLFSPWIKPYILWLIQHLSISKHLKMEQPLPSPTPTAASRTAYSPTVATVNSIKGEVPSTSLKQLPPLSLSNTTLSTLAVPTSGELLLLGIISHQWETTHSLPTQPCSQGETVLPTLRASESFHLLSIDNLSKSSLTWSLSKIGIKLTQAFLKLRSAPI